MQRCHAIVVSCIDVASRIADQQLVPLACGQRMMRDAAMSQPFIVSCIDVASRIADQRLYHAEACGQSRMMRSMQRCQCHSDVLLAALMLHRASLISSLYHLRVARG